MACPYFCPSEPLPWTKWPGKLRPPLGALYRGECRAASEPFLPSERLLVDYCNLGYARIECKRFPNGEGPDAVRFGLSADDGRTVVVAYVVERVYLPLRHGTLRYCRATKSWSDLNVDGLLARQAEAYLVSYLRSKGEEPGAAASKPPKAAGAAASGR